MNITKIVITGGPCAGKSTAMNRIREHFTQLGYTVLLVPETATELITGGVAPWTCGTKYKYQKFQIDLQIKKEEIFTAAARTMPNDKILLVCDRGVLDAKAYMSDEDFNLVLGELGYNEADLRNGYNAVFVLATAAKGAVEFYTNNNNSARIETPEQATALDDNVISAWLEHSHLRIIEANRDFEQKMQNLLSEISGYLLKNEPPYEIERKFLIEYPDVKWLESAPNCKKYEITQIYLKSNPDEEIRIRKSMCDGVCTYCKTVKRRVNDIKRVEIENEVTVDEYMSLLANADPQKHPINKTRYRLHHEGLCFEIDVYPFWQDKAIAEIELPDESAEISFPPQIVVIKEVTHDGNYKNSALANIQ